LTEAAKFQTEKRPVNKQLREESEEQRGKAQKVPELTKGSGKGGLEGSITHEWFWPRMGKVRGGVDGWMVEFELTLVLVLQFFKERDIILAETGTSAFGIINVPFPSTASCLGE
jgi:hypothetical protein